MIITLCGSTKFKDEFIEISRNLALDGHAVLGLNMYEHADGLELTAEQKIRLENAHKQKIGVSDAIFVINKEGYIGEFTFNCIDWAQRLKKEVYFLVNPNPEEENKDDGSVDEQSVTDKSTQEG